MAEGKCNISMIKGEACNSEVTKMSPEEEDLIHRLHHLLGDRWSLIAGRLPERSAEEVETYWRMKEMKNMEEEKIYKPKCIRISPYFKFLASKRNIN